MKTYLKADIVNCHTVTNTFEVPTSIVKVVCT